MREKSVKGFRTGDLVMAKVLAGKKQGTHIGRVAIRKTGSFNIQTGETVIQGIGYRYCQILQRGDGYGYTIAKSIVPEFLPHPFRSASASRLPIGRFASSAEQVGVSIGDFNES